MKKSLVLLLLPLTVLLPACSNSDSQSDPSTSESEASFNDADIMFAQMMIPHHEQAIEMSDMALDPTTLAGQQVGDLALQIKNAQDPEIKQMQRWLTGWGEPLTPKDGMDHSSMMEGMLSAEEMFELSSMNGPLFDRAWTQAMIAHHKGAVAMAEDVIADGSHPEVRELAETIISTQQAEIKTLEQLL
jgi:uncharacterized protein (DUF305 family)